MIAGGPDAGRRFALAAGEHVIGRGPGADLTLPDRSMSRRHLVLRVGTSGVTVADLGSSNGTYLEGARMDDERAFAPGQALEAGRTLLGIEPARAGERSSGPGATGGRVAFNRPPRVAAATAPMPSPAPAVPGEGDSPRLPLGAALVPLAIGGSMAAITGNPALLSFALLTPAMALFSHVEGRRSGSRRHEGEVVDFRRDVAELGEQLRAARLAGPRSAVPPAPMSRPSDAGPPRSIPACGSAVRAIRLPRAARGDRRRTGHGARRAGAGRRRDPAQTRR